jgi:Domain of unknown function (DUF397)
MAPPIPHDGPWRKSTYSAGNGACVEIAEGPDGVAVRDSKHPDGPMIEVTRAEWRAFVDAVKRGEFDRPT